MHHISIGGAPLPLMINQPRSHKFPSYLSEQTFQCQYTLPQSRRDGQRLKSPKNKREVASFIKYMSSQWKISPWNVLMLEICTEKFLVVGKRERANLSHKPHIANHKLPSPSPDVPTGSICLKFGQLRLERQAQLREHLEHARPVTLLETASPPWLSWTWELCVSS